MESIKAALLKKEPRFPAKFEYLFESFCRKFGGSEEERLNKAKAFRTFYEFYMYAFFHGLRNEMRIKYLDRGKELSKTNVSNIQMWKPIELRDYLITCAMAEENTPLMEYERMTEEEINQKSADLRLVIEEYVYGGLSLIEGQYKADKGYFNELFAFTEFVFEEDHK